MDIDPKYLRDPGQGDLHVVEGVAYVHRRDENGELLFVEDRITKQLRPLLKYVNIQSKPSGGIQAAPFEAKTDAQLTGVCLTAEEVESIKPIKSVAEKMYNHWFGPLFNPSSEAAAANRAQDLQGQDKAIEELLGLGFEKKTVVGPASHVFVQEVDAEGVMAPFGISCDRIIMEAGTGLGALRYVMLGRSLDAIVLVGPNQRLKIVAILDRV